MGHNTLGVVVHRCICRTSVVADIRLVYCHRCIGNKLDFHRWHWPMFIGMFSALLYSYSVYRECGIRRQTPFILTHTHAATITQRLPGDHIKCDQWTLLKVLLGVLRVCGACLLHGVKVYWWRVFTASLVYCLICRDISFIHNICIHLYCC